MHPTCLNIFRTLILIIQNGFSVIYTHWLCLYLNWDLVFSYHFHLFSLLHGDITISYHCQYPLILMVLKLYRLLATNENIASCGDISKPPTIYIPRFISHRIETSIYVLLYLFFFHLSLIYQIKHRHHCCKPVSFVKINPHARLFSTECV